MKHSLPQRTLTLMILCVFVTYGQAFAKAFNVIICGSGGEPEYSQKFAQWGARLRAVLVDEFRRGPDRTYLLLEKPPPGKSNAYDSRKETITGIFKSIGTYATVEDTLFVYLVGHGSYLNRVATFNIPGPDISAKDFEALLANMKTNRIVLINTASSSAAFINALSGPGRIICTATKSVDEVNATEFMESFVGGLEDGSADQNRDERISVLEACQQAAALTDTWYIGQGLIATEHALLDDDGDGLGSRLPILEAGEIFHDDGEISDGPLAATTYIRDFTFPPTVPSELVDTYLSLLKDVEALRRVKDSMELDAYYAKLESLLVEAARTHRDIRRLSGAGDGPDARGADSVDTLLLLPDELK